MNAFASLTRSVRRSCHRVLASTQRYNGEPASDRSILLTDSVPSARPASTKFEQGEKPRQTPPDDSLDNPRLLHGRERATGHALARAALLAALNHPVGDGHCRPWLDALVLAAPAAAVRAQVLEELSSLTVQAERLPLAQVGRLSPGDRDRARDLLDAMRDGIERIETALDSLKTDPTASRGFDRIRGNLQLISASLWRARWV